MYAQLAAHILMYAGIVTQMLIVVLTRNLQYQTWDMSAETVEKTCQNGKWQRVSFPFVNTLNFITKEEVIMLFCNQCGEKHGFQSVGQQKGECEICHQRIGVMNIMDDNMLKSFKAIDNTEWVCCGFKAKQVEGIIPNMPIENLYLDMQHKILSNNKIMFIGSDKLLLLDRSTGKQIQIEI